ncbi:MAG TPA: AAA family ATPase [Vicinamibacterales bacterium]
MVDRLSATDPDEIRAWLVARLDESAPGHIQLVTGPRQVGKTTLLLDLAARHGEHGLYAAADAPEAGVPGYWERFWTAAEAKAAHGKARIFHRRQGVSDIPNAAICSTKSRPKTPSRSRSR